MFFWYFPSENGDENASIILWLQGGPGATSLIGEHTQICNYTKKSKLLILHRFVW